MKNLAVIMTMALTNSLYAHEAPDFKKLPKVYLLAQEAVLSVLGVEAQRTQIGTGTAWKIGEHGGKSYFVSAGHLGTSLKFGEVPKGMGVKEDWGLYTRAEQDSRMKIKLRVEEKNIKDDYFLLSTEGSKGGASIPLCQTPPVLGEMTYVWGYFRGLLMLTEGRMGNPSIDSTLGEDDFLIDAHISPGASGSAALLYRDNNFCAYGIVKGSMDNSLGIINKLDEMLEAYEKIKSR